MDRIHDGSGINIGTGHLTTFLEVARLFAHLDGREAKISPQIDKPVGVQSRYCDPSEMQRVLEWKPTISIDEGFALVLDAARERVQQLGPLAIA